MLSMTQSQYSTERRSCMGPDRDRSPVAAATMASRVSHGPAVLAFEGAATGPRSRSGPMRFNWFHPVGLIGVISFAHYITAAATLPQFTDVTAAAGIHFKHNTGDGDLHNIVESTGPGGMFFDYDNDGFLDIYLVNGSWHPDISENRGRVFKDKLSHALYHNNGDGTFTDVTAKAGINCKSFGFGVACGDYNNDGFLDIYVLNYGTNTLYRNNGNGTFTDVTAQTGLGDPGWSLHAAWFDYNNDGHLDVFVAHYLRYDKGEFQRSGAYYKADNFPGPLSYPGTQSHLFRNNGNGTFTDVTAEAGLTYPNGRSMSVTAVDVNGDGFTDLFVSNDAGANCLWINDGKGHFTNKAVEYGVAYGEGGQGVSAMGPAVGDADRNGLLDFLVPDMGFGTLHSQVRTNQFMDVTSQSGLAQICGQYTGWGGMLVDFDNDGWLDVFIGNGDPHHLFPEESVLAWNDHHGKFLDMAKDCGDYFQHKYVSRGAAYGDYNNDGNMDVLVFNVADSPRLLRNEGGTGHHWLKVAPLAKSGLIAFQAMVTVRANGLTMLQPVIASNGYLSCSDPRAHFGLGPATEADWIQIRWPDGQTQRLEHVKADQILKVPHPR